MQLEHNQLLNMANTAKDGEDGHSDMETTRNNKTVQPTLQTAVSQGLGILARIIAREEICKRGWDNAGHSGSPIDEMTRAMLQPVFRKTLVNE